MRTVDKIQEVLDSKSIKASKMMKDLGFSSGLFSQWKSDKQEVSLEKIIKIADYLECSIDYLLGRTEDAQGNYDATWSDAHMFTERFVEMLQSKNITAYKVAKETSISQGLMNQYKNGEKIPTYQNLVKIADFLECSTDYLLERTDNPFGTVGNINGNNNIQANGLSTNGNVNLSAGEEKRDELSEELFRNFNMLTTMQKAKIIVMIDEMRKET